MKGYRFYDSDFILEHYKSNVSHDVFFRCLESKRVRITDDELAEMERKKQEQEDFDRRLKQAMTLNNEGLAFEDKGDIASAVSKYEENILQGTYFTLHPYHRLCVIYRKAGDYDNEIRVIETCLARPEWTERRYANSRDKAFFADRLAKAKSYRDKKTHNL